MQRRPFAVRALAACGFVISHELEGQIEGFFCIGLRTCLKGLRGDDCEGCFLTAGSSDYLWEIEMNHGTKPENVGL